MEQTAPLKTPLRRRSAPVTLWRRGLFLAPVLLIAACAGLIAFGLPWWEALLWAAALALALPLRAAVGERAGLWASRLFWVLGPAVGFCLVEALNYNNPFTSFSALQVALNLGFYYLLAGLLFLACGRRNLSAGLAAGLFWAVGMANHYVIRFRGRTIFPGDLLTLKTAANVAGNYNYAFDATQLRTLLVLALFLLLLLALPRQKGRSPLRLRSALPMAAAGAVFLGVFFGTGFLSRAGIEPSMWTTRGNGFVLNFSVCLRYSRVSPPEGYSQEALNGIAGAHSAGGVPAVGTGEEETRPVNLIVIMNESFSDLTETFGLETNQDPMPFLHALTENTVKGTAYASVFGGTTANSEYEFLTGNSMAFLPAGTVPFHLYVKEGSESVAAQMNALGYHTLAMHPYLSSGWNRVAVYRDLGFDEWFFQSEFQDPSYMRDYITDQSNYEELIRRYEAKEEGQPLFVFNVTMQNHSAYNVAWKNLPREVWLTGDLEGRFSTVDQYLSLVYQSDKAFAYLTDYFSAVEEPTMILMFGDHQPQVATNFYTELLGDDPDLEALQQKYAVPFVLWANYDIEERAGLELSVNYLSSLLMETANLPMTGYQRFLSGLRETVPALNANGYMGLDGAWYERAEDMSQDAKEQLLQYQMLQYNELFEEREDRLKDFFFLPEG